MEHQIHFGKKFYLDRKTGYWISTSCPKIRAHVWVWKNYNGEIPKGFHIHHKDENKSNNSIENLEIMSVFNHLSLHASTPERIERSSKWCEIIRPMTKEWHASEEGRKWHIQHGVRVWSQRKSFEGNCEVCGALFSTKTYHQIFCSNKCKSQWRRNNKVDEVEKICLICKKTYMKSKYARSRTCGRKCGRLL